MLFSSCKDTFQITGSTKLLVGEIILSYEPLYRELLQKQTNHSLAITSRQRKKQLRLVLQVLLSYFHYLNT